MRFIAHTFSMGRVSLYFSYKAQNRLIFLNINLVKLDSDFLWSQRQYLAGQSKV